MITPIYKKGSKDKIINYRPISLLPCVSKIFERCLKSRLVKFLEENDILNKTQFGFRKGVSTNDAIIELVEGIYAALDAGEKAAAVFMDLSKSFDTVDHRKLIQILEDIGVTGKPLNLFRTYLSGRTQKVKLKIPNKPLTDKSNNQRTARDIGSLINSEVVSDEIDCVPYSVPQGTVLSPILYNIYVSNLNNLPLQGQLISFADDTALRVVGESWDEVFQKIQSDMVRIKFWFANHNLFLNMDKTKIVPFCMDTRNYPNFTSLKIHEHSCNPNLNIINIPMPNLPDTQCDCAHIENTNTNFEVETQGGFPPTRPLSCDKIARQCRATSPVSTCNICRAT
ncbi:hypothetical protein M8J77_019265 [Diaphorina citri]|nr:hypothetical protein M8J77_019265 [Diaphorina citri]